MLAAALCVAAASASPAARAAAVPDGFGQLLGTGTASGAGCSGPFAIAGVATGSSWSFVVTFAGAGATICASAGAPLATGTWNPAVGGCLSGATGLICVGKVPATMTPTAAAVSFCIPSSTCSSGTATVVRL